MVNLLQDQILWLIKIASNTKFSHSWLGEFFFPEHSAENIETRY